MSKADSPQSRLQSNRNKPSFRLGSTNLIRSALHVWALCCSTLPLVAFLLLAGTANVRAGLTFELYLYTYNGSYIFYTPLSTNATLPSAPLGDYTILSPQQPTNGSWRQFELSSNGLSLTGGGEGFYGDFASVMQGITNGLWSIIVTNAMTTNIYRFSVSAPNMTPNLLPLTTITFPIEGAIDVTNRPTFTWVGPTNWPSSYFDYVAQYDLSYNSTFFQYAYLPSDQTNWTIPEPIPSGTNTLFTVQAVTNYTTPLFIATIPTNIVSSQILSEWESTSTLQSSATVNFMTAPSTSSTPAHILIGHYTFDYSGDLGHDSSGYGNDLTGISSWGLQHQFATTAIAGGGAVQFFGTSSLTPSDTTRTNWDLALAGSFSVSAWVNSTESIGDDSDNAYFGATIFWAFNDHYSTNDTIPLAITGSRAAFTTRGGDPGAFDNLHSASVVNDGNYHLITVTRNQATGEKRIYVDGLLEASEIGTTAPLNGNDYYLSIGGTTSSSYAGFLDDLQFYTGVLSDFEIASLYAQPGQVVSNSAGFTPLGPALNAPELRWTTDGDSTWFGQTTRTHDLIAAAQSGVVTNFQTSSLQTTINGPGTLTFWWQNPGTDLDFDLEFDLDGAYQSDIQGPQPWIQAGPIQIGPGTHTLTWYVSANGSSDSTAAGYLDQVRFVPQIEVNLQLQFARDQDLSGKDHFLLFPFFSSITPAPTTLHTVESASGDFIGEQGGDFSSSSTQLDTLESVIERCTNGNWTLHFNKGAANEQKFTFKVSLIGLTTNILQSVRILSPTNGSVDVATNAPLSWSGPPNLPSIFVNVFPVASGLSGAYTNLTSPTTQWPNPPTLPVGTNQFYVAFSTNSFSGVTFSDPVDESMNTLDTWATSATLRSSANAQFVVGLPRTTLTNPLLTSSGFQFSFPSIAGHPHTVQTRTNLVTGSWLDLTNVIGDGTLQQFTFPSTNPTARYFRVRSN